MARHRIVALVLVSALGAGLLGAADRPSQDSPEKGFERIFDGKSLDGWDGDPRFWSVQDGAITGKTTSENPARHNTFIIWRGGKLENFELRIKIKIIGGNSGIQYRSKVMDEPHKWGVGGYQADFEAGGSYSGILYDERGTRGVMAGRGEKVVFDKHGKRRVVEKFSDGAAIEKIIKKQTWNDYTILAQGPRLIHKINGVTTVDVMDLDAAKQSLSGILALQIHSGPLMQIQFKDIRLKRLP